MSFWETLLKQISNSSPGLFYSNASDRHLMASKIYSMLPSLLKESCQQVLDLRHAQVKHLLSISKELQFIGYLNNLEETLNKIDNRLKYCRFAALVGAVTLYFHSSFWLMLTQLPQNWQITLIAFALVLFLMFPIFSYFQFLHFNGKLNNIYYYLSRNESKLWDMDRVVNMISETDANPLS